MFTERGPSAWLTPAAPLFMITDQGPSAWLTVAASSSMITDRGPSACHTLLALPSMFTDRGPSTLRTLLALPSMFTDRGPTALPTPAALPSMLTFLWWRSRQFEFSVVTLFWRGSPAFVILQCSRGIFSALLFATAAAGCHVHSICLEPNIAVFPCIAFRQLFGSSPSPSSLSCVVSMGLSASPASVAAQ